MKKRARFHIKGQVQGVGFRHFAWRTAGKFRLDGYVRNLPDGTVEVVACGEEDSIKNYARLLGKGPEFSYVRSISEKWEENNVDEFTGFDVRF